MSDTIFALSSGQPPAAIAVIRISGPRAFAAIEALAGGLPVPRRASLRTLREGDDHLDRALVLIFPGPDTATGEDLAELHLHGGRAVVRVVESALAGLPGLRAAEAGEFTRRALRHGRIDLTEAEGLADLLAAETEGQRRAALRAAEGGLRRRIEHWAERTVGLSATLEAMLDHSDEDDVVLEAETLECVASKAAALATEIEAVIAQPGTERLRDGVRVVLAGAPNAGKSSLLNALIGRDVAIVSPIAGTTRDRIEAPVMRDGIAYLFTDTAGLHDSPGDRVEQIGIERARAALASADILLWLDDRLPVIADDRAVILVHPRADLAGREVGQPGRISVSALTGDGLAALWSQIAQVALRLVPLPDAVPMNLRQRDLAAGGAASLRRIAGVGDPILCAEELRAALRGFHRITGAADVESMLDSLFGRFCIGK